SPCSAATPTRTAASASTATESPATSRPQWCSGSTTTPPSTAGSACTVSAGTTPSSATTTTRSRPPTAAPRTTPFQTAPTFGLKRDSEPTEGALLPQDTFPDLIATTRGWLSPGTHAPLVATGGTGNDEFTVYSNQAELRLEGDDDNDLFVVRAFALAATCDTSTDFTAGCDWNDVTIVANPDTGQFPSANSVTHACTKAANPWIAGDLKDNNHDGVCNNADASMTAAYEDDIIPLDPVTGQAAPKIGLGFSTARPLDIRAGGGEDEVQYNVNAPVSVDGGTGFDKLVILGTEFADDIVITSKAIYGAGLNVRYANVEIVEVDGLEGDDEFFVQSTAYGVAYRVIGGLGS